MLRWIYWNGRTQAAKLLDRQLFRSRRIRRGSKMLCCGRDHVCFRRGQNNSVGPEGNSDVNFLSRRIGRLCAVAAQAAIGLCFDEDNFSVDMSYQFDFCYLGSPPCFAEF